MKRVKTEDEIKKLLKSDKPVVVFFYADWCPHCHAMQKPYSDLEKEHKDVTFVKMESEDIPSELGIMGYPHFEYVKNGSVIRKVDGEMPKEELKAKLFGGQAGLAFANGGKRRGGRRTRTSRLRNTRRKVLH
jgi:thioredoxin 1